MDVEKFIEFVRKSEILWNLQAKDYKNIRKKNEKWRQISKHFGISVDKCKKKWKGLRDSYSRARSKQMLSGKSTDEMEAGWKHSRDLEFLDKHLRPRYSVRNSVKTDDSNPLELDVASPMHLGEAETYLDELAHSSPDQLRQQTPTPNTSKSSSQISGKKRSQDLETELSDTMKCIQDFVKNTPRTVVSDVPLEDEDDLYCRLLMCKLKKFPLLKRNELMLYIMCYLNDMEAEEEQNKNNT